MEQAEKQSKWIYECEPDNTVRYVLGEQFADPQSDKALICIGVNPSTATPEKLDPTLNRVRRYAQKHRYGAWYMLNLYPQRATNPNDMDKQGDGTKHRRNIAAIRKLLQAIPEADVWCAWGVSICKRAYLTDFLHGKEQNGTDGILVQFDGNYRFMAYAETKYGYPRHPLMMRKTDVLQPLDRFQQLNAELGLSRYFEARDR